MDQTVQLVAARRKATHDGCMGAKQHHGSGHVRVGCLHLGNAHT